MLYIFYLLGITPVRKQHEFPRSLVASTPQEVVMDRFHQQYVAQQLSTSFLEVIGDFFKKSII